MSTVFCTGASPYLLLCSGEVRPRSIPMRTCQGDVRVVPISQAIEESVDLAHEIFNRVFRKVTDKMLEKQPRTAVGGQCDATQRGILPGVVINRFSNVAETTPWAYPPIFSPGHSPTATGFECRELLLAVYILSQFYVLSAEGIGRRSVLVWPVMTREMVSRRLE